MLGNGRLEAMCIDNVKRMCHIRGKMRKKVWVNTVSARISSIFVGFVSICIRFVTYVLSDKLCVLINGGGM